MRTFYVYILASNTRVLYVGMTNDLEYRLAQHRSKSVPGFTAKYNVTQLVWYETFPDAAQAIAWEKRIKGWSRAKKIALIEEMNPLWLDLTDRAVAPTSSEPVLPETAPRHPECTHEGSSLDYSMQDSSRVRSE
jgi:putative endonuclease